MLNKLTREQVQAKVDKKVFNIINSRFKSMIKSMITKECTLPLHVRCSRLTSGKVFKRISKYFYMK